MEILLVADCRTRQLASDDPGPVLQWTTRRASPALILELGRLDRPVYAVAVLPDGRLVSGGDSRVRLWDVQSSSPGSLLACAAYVLAAFPPSGARLFIGHAWGGISCWEVRAAAQNTPGARHRPG